MSCLSPVFVHMLHSMRHTKHITMLNSKLVLNSRWLSFGNHAVNYQNNSNPTYQDINNSQRKFCKSGNIHLSKCNSTGNLNVCIDCNCPREASVTLLNMTGKTSVQKVNQTSRRCKLLPAQTYIRKNSSKQDRFLSDYDHKRTSIAQ